jgi:DtxR family Mn-dependent transcriptional regulator
MGFTWDQVDAEAHRMEHAISAEFEDRIDRLCNHPTHCPHGDPIPRKDGSLPEEALTPMLAMKPGEQGVLRRVGFTDARVLRYLERLSLVPGRRLRLIERAPFNGPVTLEVSSAGANGHNDQPAKTQVLGNELADQLFVAVGE